MDGALPRDTGLDARFDAELQAEVPGWKPASAFPTVRHDAAACRFELELDSRTAVVEYELRPGEMVITHTFVPPELRGRGLAGHVVRAALTHAREAGWKVVPQCSYVVDFLQRHPEFREPGGK